LHCIATLHCADTLQKLAACVPSISDLLAFADTARSLLPCLHRADSRREGHISSIGSGLHGRIGLRIGEGGGTTHDISHRRSRSCVHGVWSRWNNISASASGGALSAAPCPKGWLTRELTDRFCVAPAPLRATGVGVGRPVRRSVEVAQCSRDHSESDVNGFIKWMQPLCLAFSYVKCWNIRIFFLSSF